jgi:hypothetical protein
MKKRRPVHLDKLSLNRETLRLLEASLRDAQGGASRPHASCYPIICVTTTVASDCC